jgi:phage FluMu protein Com
VDSLDGNAIAGPLFEHYGHEMTMAEVRCLHCHHTSMIAELRVYMKAPGAVARCPDCDELIMVIVDVRGTTRLHTQNMELLRPA